MAEIIAKNICLDYPIFGASSRSFKKIFLNVTTGGTLANDSNNIVVQALTDVSFHLKDGDRLALIGHNGAGKSTLLRVLAGVYAVSRGHLQIAGSIATLLDISLGMQVEATGYENIYIRGLLMGLKRGQIKQLIPDIEKFTELGEFLSMPIKTYSNGMRVRLAFAISTALTMEILLVDESVGAGDAAFKDKARQRIEKLIDNAHIMVLASHDEQFIQGFCNKALWLEHGQVKQYGDMSEVLNSYYASLTK